MKLHEYTILYNKFTFDNNFNYCSFLSNKLIDLLEENVSNYEFNSQMKCKRNKLRF